MQKNIFLLLVVMIFFGINLSAQKADEVSLKNGSVIRGHIVKIIPDGAVTINDKAGNTWVYQMTEIDKIEEVDSNLGAQGPGFSSGWVNMTGIGFLAGSQSSQYIAPFSILTSVGYRNDMGIYTGLLTGLEFIDITHIPIMFDFQYSLRQGDVTPVLIARGGYTLPSKFTDEMYSTTYTYSGGLAGAIGVGLKIRSKDIFAWDVSVLYRYMEIKYTQDYQWQTYQNETEYRDVYNRLELRVGFYLGR